MTFEFLKEKYPKEGLVVVHSIRELQNVVSEYEKAEVREEKLLIQIPAECVELRAAGIQDSLQVTIGILEYYSLFDYIEIFVTMSLPRYRRGLGLR